MNFSDRTRSQISRQQKHDHRQNDIPLPKNDTYSCQNRDVVPCSKGSCVICLRQSQFLFLEPRYRIIRRPNRFKSTPVKVALPRSSQFLSGKENNVQLKMIASFPDARGYFQICEKIRSGKQIQLRVYTRYQSFATGEVVDCWYGPLVITILLLR